MSIKVFPNGFESWMETHHEVVEFISDNNSEEMWEMQNLDCVVRKRAREAGTGGLYELGEEWTDSFEKQYKGQDWVDLDYFEEVSKFLTDKNKL